MQQRKQRRRARKTALQIFYGSEITGVPISDILEGRSAVPDIVVLDDYSMMLLKGVPQKYEEINKIIDDASDNWTLSRMPIVDRCLIRQTVYEMLYVDEVPVSVSINEAVELAKQFGAEDDSHKFVNGVLGKIAKNLS